mgnify:CR=1 FL=1
MVHIYCGDGKGKTTAAMGLALRMAGAGKQVLIGQFFKNGSSGEIKILKTVPGVTAIHCRTVPGRYVHMTDTEKKLLQAQHRLEEAQARDRVKERKMRTRRLIQEGAILEKVLPEVQAIELSELEGYLSRKLGKQI